MSLSALKRFFRKRQEQLERHFLGSLLQKITWRFRHVYRQNWAEDYLISTGHPHRQQIVDSIASFSPVQNVLEIGCASGANLIRIREKFPDIHMTGIDINPKAIRVAQNYFKTAHDKKTSFFVKTAEDLSQFEDGSIDLVFTDAVLMFVTPTLIEQVLSEMARVAKKGIILNEYYKKDAINGYFDGGRWVYDFPVLLQKQLPAAHIQIKESSFTGGSWDKFGRLIEIKL